MTVLCSDLQRSLGTAGPWGSERAWTEVGHMAPDPRPAVCTATAELECGRPEAWSWLCVTQRQAGPASGPHFLHLYSGL